MPSQPANLGPMTLADIVDNAFRLFKANWKQIALVVFILSIPTMILEVVLAASGGSTLTNFFEDLQAGAEGTTAEEIPFGATEVVALVLSVLIALLVQPFVTGVITRIVAASYLGQHVDAAESARGLLKKWPAFIVATILVALTVFGAVMVVVLPVAILGAAVHPAFFALMLLVFVPLVALNVLLAVVIPVIAVEETGPLTALSRSWALMRRRFWPYLGTFIVVGLVAIIAAIIVGSVVGIFQMIAGAIWGPLEYPFIALSNFTSNLVVMPILAIAVTLVYFDARIRNEGFDLQVMASRLPSTGVPDSGADPIDLNKH